MPKQPRDLTQVSMGEKQAQEPDFEGSGALTTPFRLKTVTTTGKGVACEGDWDTIRSLIYGEHGG
jgi:hypothetical protein